jgi:DNA ligase (NAD+)
VIALIETLRPTLDFDIDGAVVKVDSEMARDRIGVASRHPKWALAWKYAAEETRSVLRDIEVTVGRTGRVAFTAVIEPVDVAGATVGKATLHNADFIAANRLGIGSDVLVSRANDVIPRVVGLDTERNATVTPWTPPTDCPQCGEAFDISQANWRCHTAECSVVGWLTYFAGRDNLSIDGLGESIVEALVDADLVSSPADLYDLSVADLATLETCEGRQLGEKNAQKIYDSIQKSKTQPFNRVLAGLGIRLTGRSVSRWLAAEFHTMQALQAATVSQIAAIEKMGAVKAQAVVDGLTARTDVIERLADAGVNMGSEATEQGDLPLAGQTYVVSGTVPGYTRTTVQERIETLGGKASSSVSNATAALVTSETETSKAKKAAELGIPVIDPTEFAQMLAG